MFTKSFFLFWLLLVPALAASVIESYFVLKKEDKLDTNSFGGCKSRIKTLEKWVAESKTMVNAGLQALNDAELSNDNSDMARRYLKTYFHMTVSDAVAMKLVRDSLESVKKFLDQELKLAQTPRLYCSDTWLEKKPKTDVAFDGDETRDLMRLYADGTENPITIGDQYKEKLFIIVKGKRIELVPYWSHDMKWYIFDVDYNGGTFCFPKYLPGEDKRKNLGATQQKTPARTVTLCPKAFTNSDSGEFLGSKNPKNVKIENVLPRSATFYHELFHLILGYDETPDTAYEFREQQEFLNNPDYKEEHEPYSNVELIRRNPETYVWFSVGYWYSCRQSGVHSIFRHGHLLKERLKESASVVDRHLDKMNLLGRNKQNEDI